MPQWVEHMRQRFTSLDMDAWRALAQRLGLDDHLEKSIYMLSTGSMRKLYLCTVLCAGARLTLVDEPFAALDHASVATVLDELRTWESQTDRACVVADYVPPPGVQLAQRLVMA